MNLHDAWRVSRLWRLPEGIDSLVCRLGGYEEYGIEWWPSPSDWMVGCRMRNEISVFNEIWTPCWIVRYSSRESRKEDRIECHFSPSRKAMCFMCNNVITDSSKVTMVHFSKDG
jgi:hypothetical protein